MNQKNNQAAFRRNLKERKRLEKEIRKLNKKNAKLTKEITRLNIIICNNEYESND